MGKSKILVFPSECYECMPRTIIESFAHSTPVIASNLGTMTEMIGNGKTGLHFEPGNFLELAQRVVWANAHPDEITHMGHNARTEYEAKFTPMRNYTRLMEIYEQTIENHTKRQNRANRN